MHWKPCTVLAPATYCSTTAAGNPNPSARRRSLTGIVMNSWRKKRRGASNMLHNVQVRMTTQAYSSNGRRGSTYSTKHKTHFTVRTHVSSRVKKTLLQHTSLRQCCNYVGTAFSLSLTHTLSLPPLSFLPFLLLFSVLFFSFSLVFSSVDKPEVMTVPSDARCYPAASMGG